MSELIKHECGFAFIRLLKPLEYFQSKYGNWMYGINRMYLMMEKQRNRGQDGAGMASVKLDTLPGTRYIDRTRSNSSHPIVDVFDEVRKPINAVRHENPELLKDAQWAKSNMPFAGEIYLGHLRYGTFGKNDIDNVHPVMRENNWKSKNLAVAGNFNLTNVGEMFQSLVDLGQHPKGYSDTVTILEQIGHQLDEENQLLFDTLKKQGLTHKEISAAIARDLDLKKILANASAEWDGGYVISGIIGHGDAFIMRDINGIRPAWYYADDEIVVGASERAVIQTVMKLPEEKIKPVKPGHAVIVKKNGTWSEEMIKEPGAVLSCSFERIYFSRGSDREIYNERKKLGELIVPQIIDAVNGELDHSVFSFIPNTSETAFYGMMKGIETHMLQQKMDELGNENANHTRAELHKIINARPRVEKIAIKDVKLRTFITGDESRDDLVEHVYDITYGTVEANKDNLVVIDDSIVRGTTLRRSILRILDRLNPKRIVVVSSSPQIRYPDCYGIDMAKLSDFIAFNAAIGLLKDRGQYFIINEVYKKCKEQEHLPKEQVKNHVKEIYAPFKAQEISDKIAELMHGGINAEVKVVYQSIENLHKAIPNDKGDWYFTGNYPTSGGNKVVNQSFINFIEGKNERAY
ncbi:Amidophosphoribosyltransferase precursor [Salinivirga cyanobacteriivorans]|uniref:Amidophosphoribosyltransferase n=1 Tax=Salinivirga cyanobacteriivorans TaxID=1307839 RepID=A0A0S2HYM4_9BACT|nr:amidophosphoribosyltransferase [Salinivirga cyanobacteriivorans]ALO15175.1 Amidophosphoribosyltransferase precursor [Salinivirga cyanobacteriivorans]